MKATTKSACRKYVCASERVKLIGSLDGLFPDFGHHEEKEMGGLWLHPIKLLDGFWLRFCDKASENVDTWIIADGFENMPEGNLFTYRSGLGHTPVTIDRFQLAPEGVNGVTVTYTLRNHSEKARPVSLEFLVQTDLRPVWFSDNVGIRDGEQDEGAWYPEDRLFYARDCGHEWHVALGCSEAPAKALTGNRAGPQNTSHQGVGVSLFLELALKPGETKSIDFYIAGSFLSRVECLQEYRKLKAGRDFLKEKQLRYDALLDRSRLKVADSGFCETFDWVKVNTDWLIQDSGPYGRGLTAGLPEYPWWFGCDNCYALQGILAMGDFTLCRDTLELILRYSEQHNGNGRILHEVTTGGVCVNPGNTQETAHFLTMVFHYYQWTGDRDFIVRAYPYLQKSVAWLDAQDADNDLFPSGYGIIEIAGLHSELIDTAVYTCVAYGCFGAICRLMGNTEEAKPWEEKAELLNEAINTKMWDEEAGLYCDAFTSYPEVAKNQATILGKVQSALHPEISAGFRALLEKKKPLGDTESGWLLSRNWVINTPMEMGIAPKEQAERALKRMHTPEFIGPYGMYLSALTQNSAMTISTGVMAVAQARYGHSDRALELINRMFSTFSKATPGTISEMSPDYGCFVQAWTAYAVMVPIVQYFFGIQPDVYNSRVVIDPCMPAEWKQASLQNVHVPGGILNLDYQEREGRKCYRISGHSEKPLYFSLTPEDTWLVNGKVSGPSSKRELIPVEPLS